MNPQEVRETFINSYRYDEFMSNWLCDNLYCSVCDIEDEILDLCDEEMEDLYVDYLVDEERFKEKKN